MLFVTIQGGLGNQLFQAALILWLRAAWGISAHPLDPGCQGQPGPMSRVCQIDQLFPDLQVKRGFAVYLLHALSLSRKWQHLVGDAGFVSRIADESTLNQVLRQHLELPSFRGFPKVFVFSGHLQRLGLFSTIIPSMIKSVRPILLNRSIHIDNMLFGSGRLPLASTLIIHVRRGDVLSLQDAVLLQSDYYMRALEVLSERDGCSSLAVAVVSDEPEVALGLIKRLVPSAFILNLDDPLDVLAAMAMSHALILANSTLSLWGAVFSVSRANVIGPCIPSVGNCDWFETLLGLDVQMVAASSSS